MMVLNASYRQLFARFADVLAYPGPELSKRIRACEALCDEYDPEVSSWLQAFRLWTRTVEPGRLQEIYSGLFDLDPSCSLYVGHYLLGESYKRSAFLLELQQRYREHGYEPDPATELADHLVVLLRFLANCDDEDEIRVIVVEGVMPALDAMLGEEPTPEPQLTGSGAPMPVTADDEPPMPATPPDEAEAGGDGEGNHPYLNVLRALRRALAARFADAVAVGEHEVSGATGGDAHV